MTRRCALVAVLLVGCTSSVETLVERRSPDAAVDPVVDAGDEPAVTPADCPRGSPAQTSVVYGTACDGGFRYGTSDGVCPTGNVGTCSILVAQNAITGYGETCCQHLACVRQAFGDHQCQAELDGTPIRGREGTMMWGCPWSNGKLLAQPPGKCALYAPALSDSHAVAYCCRE